jgi:hypothetical protein
MSRFKALGIFLVVGLIATLIPLTLVLAQGGERTVEITDTGDALSNVADIQLMGLPVLGADQAYEGWFVSDDGSRKESAGILRVVDGMVDQTFWLAASESSTTFNLGEQNASGQSGTATLTQEGADVRVELTLSAGAMETEFVHIHSGQCGPTLGGVAHFLTSFTGGSGSSVTVLEGISLNNLRTGNFAVNSHQAGNLGTYTACGNIPVGNPTGENLFAAFDKFVVTIEPIPDPDLGPSGVVPLIHAIPTGGIIHIRHLTYSWQGNPAYTAGFHEGTPKGIAVGLREQTKVALDHARLSIRSATLAQVHQHAEHVVNIIEGGAGRDLDGDGSPQNPGDTFGVLNYAVDAAKHTGFSADAVPNDPVITMHGQEVINSANQVHAWAGDARDAAMQALGVTDEAAAKLFIANAETILANALDSSKQAYWSAQNMGTYAFGAEAPAPVPEEPTDPKVGDSSVPGMALAVLVVGAILLVIGAYVYRRTRSRA